MRFSKEKFLENAPAWVKRQLKSHLDLLDGMEVSFGGKWGLVPQYFAEGREYYLYPVAREWCI